jgi:hypothetical protein
MFSACFNPKDLSVEQSALYMKTLLQYEKEFITHSVTARIHGRNTEGVYSGINPDTMQPYGDSSKTPMAALKPYGEGGERYREMAVALKKLNLNHKDMPGPSEIQEQLKHVVDDFMSGAYPEFIKGPRRL